MAGVHRRAGQGRGPVALVVREGSPHDPGADGRSHSAVASCKENAIQRRRRHRATPQLAVATVGSRISRQSYGEARMNRFLLKCVRYVRCYGELSLGFRPGSLEALVDYCVDRPGLMGQVRSEILEFGKLLRELAPSRSLEIGTNYGGTLFLLCEVSSPEAKVISVDLPWGPFGGGYPRRKIPIFRRFAKSGQELHLIRADSHLAETKRQVLQLLQGEKLDFVFIDADHTYEGVSRDFE